MIELNNNYVAMGAEECPLELETTRFDLKCDLNNNHKALFIDFKMIFNIA